MTKKQAKTKKEKVSAKSAKKAPASTKAKPVKAVKKAVKPAPSKSVKPVKKAVVVSKKDANKKADKKTAKVVKPKPVAKKANVTATKKTEKVVKKPSVEAKKEKEVVAKKSAKKIVKKEKEVEKKQPQPVAKKTKKEKPEKAKKKKKGDDDDDDAPEIVDLWETVEEDEEIEVDGPKPAKTSKGGRKPKSASDDDEPIIENDILIEQLINSTKKLKKPGPKQPLQIRTFVNPHASLTVPQSVDSKKGAPKKEPKGKFELEYVVRTSAPILYEFLTSPSGLSEWFADNVNIHDGIFTFFWDGSEQKARLLGFKEDKFIRLQWLDKPEGSYFEFRIERDELTGDVSLMVTDFADEGSDMQTSKLLWDSQVHKLSQVIGSY